MTDCKRSAFCRYNVGVSCDEHDKCDKCGWCPETHERRMESIREELKRKAIIAENKRRIAMSKLRERDR